ncbi:MAG: pyrimidine 5'-nucleotidase [Alphaproteobacteria bacterium]|nr:pyrimidine 5'-nucleotidase [Alphaproteobacteria bacterium SS10]
MTNQFDHIDTWVFDLDNTLYSARDGVFVQVHRRMGQFIEDRFGLDRDAAKAMQRDYFHKHGTTLRGLMTEKGINPHDYLDFVHDIDLSVIDMAPSLNEALQELPGRKIIYTNATTPYASRILERLTIDHHFDGIFDIVAADFAPKPDGNAFDQFLRDHKVTAGSACMVEDMAVNLGPAAERGMTTVWLREDHGDAHHHHMPGKGEVPAYVHHVIDDLEVWLAKVIGEKPHEMAANS